MMGNPGEYAAMIARRAGSVIGKLIGTVIAIRAMSWALGPSKISDKFTMKLAEASVGDLTQAIFSGVFLGGLGLLFVWWILTD